MIFNFCLLIIEFLDVSSGSVINYSQILYMYIVTSMYSMSVFTYSFYSVNP